MIKQPPSAGRIFAMLAFALSCVGILTFLWLSFGGSIPLAPKSYRFEVAVPEAATLAPEADVRIAGVNVGTVKRKKLDEDGARTLVEVELEPRYGPIARDARATLRQKTLFGESYIELAPGHDAAGMLPEGGRLADAKVQPSVELDEVADVFDAPTRRALGDTAGELAQGLGDGGAQDLGHALGTLPGLTTDFDALLRVLDREGLSLRRLVRNGGVVFGALNDRRGALRGLIGDAGATFEALASEDQALAETVRIMPTFLDEARVTTARLERSLTRAAPLVRDLGPVADDLLPTLRDLHDLAPDLEATFRDLDPLIDASRAGLPALERTVRGARPVLGEIHPFAQELNPVASLLSFYQERVAAFVANAGAVLNYTIGGERVVATSLIFDPRSFEEFVDRPEFDRGNAYLQPSAFDRRMALGNYESFDCSRATGPRNRFGDVKPEDAADQPAPAKLLARRPPCLVAGPSLYDGGLFISPKRGEAPVNGPPRGPAGALPLEGRP